eukprot:761819-Rhodomonas_salina.1
MQCETPRTAEREAGLMRCQDQDPAGGWSAAVRKRWQERAHRSAAREDWRALWQDRASQASRGRCGATRNGPVSHSPGCNAHSGGRKGREEGRGGREIPADGPPLQRATPGTSVRYVSPGHRTPTLRALTGRALLGTLGGRPEGSIR